MCGIVGAVARSRHGSPADRRPQAARISRLRLGRHRAARRGLLRRVRSTGRVADLEAARGGRSRFTGFTGIAHTRWATHGAPTRRQRASARLATTRSRVVHNGIIENHDELRDELKALGYASTSQTDTEVIAHLVDQHVDKARPAATPCSSAIARLHGAYAIAVISTRRTRPRRRRAPRLPAGRRHRRRRDTSSRPTSQALIRYTRHVHLPRRRRRRRDHARRRARIRRRRQRRSSAPMHTSERIAGAAERGAYRHYMQKEIFEQPRAIADTLEGASPAITCCRTSSASTPTTCSRDVDNVQILACGTSYHAGLVARYWIEGDRRHSVQRRDRQRIPLPRRRRAEPGHAVRHDLAVRRNRRHAGGAEARASRSGTRARSRSATCPTSSMVRESELRLTDARRHRRSASPRPRRSPRSSPRSFAARADARASCDGRVDRSAGSARCSTRCATCRARCSDALALEPQIIALGRALRAQAPRAVPRPRRALSDRARRRAQAQGNLLHPRRGVSGRRAQARTAGAGRRGHAGGRDRAERRSCWRS